jgi:hypothetical protein
MPFTQPLRLLNQPTSRANKIQIIAVIFDLTDLPQFRGASGWVMLEKHFDETRLREIDKIEIGFDRKRLVKFGT